MKSQIHHCPFCGESDADIDDYLCVSVYRRTDDMLGDFRVRCENCDAFGPPGTSEEDAVKEWNAWIDNLLATIRKMERRAKRDEARAHHEVSRESSFDMKANGSTGR